jgi:hypothetical protein
VIRAQQLAIASSRLLRFARNDGAKGRHCEERSDEAISLVRGIGFVLIFLLVAVALAGCGKKGSPQPPPGEPNTFPRVYPSV